MATTPAGPTFPCVSANHMYLCRPGPPCFHHKRIGGFLADPCSRGGAAGSVIPVHGGFLDVLLLVILQEGGEEEGILTDSREYSCFPLVDGHITALIYSLSPSQGDSHHHLSLPL